MASAISRRALIGASCLLIAAAVGLWYWSPWSGDPGTANALHDDTPAGRAVLWHEIRKQAKTGPSPAASRKALLRALRIMRGRPERMPPRMRAHIRKTIGTPPGGLRLERAQYARTSAGGIWITSGKRVTCLAQADRGAVACDSVAAFAEQGLVLGAFKAPAGRPRDFLVLGVAPDWAMAARLQTRDGPARVPIQGNAYALRSAAPITLKRLER